MRDPVRIDRMIEKLRHVWDENSDMRLGQLLENLSVSYDLSPPKLYHVEDDVMEQHIDAVLAFGWETARKQ